MPEHPDFRYLCDLADKQGFVVGLSVSKPVERDSSNYPVRRELESIRLRRRGKGEGVARVIAIRDDLDAASRQAQRWLAERDAA